MTVRRRPIAGQITAAGVRRPDGLVLFVGTKRTDVDPVTHLLIKLESNLVSCQSYIVAIFSGLEVKNNKAQQAP
jgi:hypothetical protein